MPHHRWPGLPLGYPEPAFVNDRVRRCSEGRPERDSLAARVFHLDAIPSLKKATVTVFGLLECRCQTALNSWTANLSLALFVHRTFAPFSS